MINRLLPTTAIVVSLLSLGIAGCTQTSNTDQASSTAVGPEQVETLMRLGDYSLASGDTAGAISIYRRAHVMEPAAIEPLSRLGAALTRLGSYEEAAGAYRTALELEPANAEMQRGLANALIALRRPQEALRFLQPTSAATEPGQTAPPPTDPRVQNSLGVAYDMMGRHDQAQQSYRQGLSASPNDLTLKSNLALSMSLNGQHAQAVDLARQSASHPQATIRHRRTLAMILAFADREAEAADVLRSVDSEAEVARNLAYYSQLKRIPASGDRAAAIGGAGAPAITQ